MILDKDKAIFEYIHKHYQAWFPALTDHTLLIHQWASLWQVEQVIWQTLVKQSDADCATIQVIDTVPVPVCKVKRYKRRHIFCDDVLLEPQVRYCASKDWYDFGFKGGVRIVGNGMIVHAPLLMARAHDSQHMDALLAGTVAITFVLTDKVFLDQDKQTALQEDCALQLLMSLRAGMHPTAFVLSECWKGLRQLVETVNGQLVDHFKVQELRIRKSWTLLARWFRKVLAYTICVWLNLQLGRSPLDFAGLVSIT